MNSGLKDSPKPRTQRLSIHVPSNRKRPPSLDLAHRTLAAYSTHYAQRAGAELGAPATRAPAQTSGVPTARSSALTNQSARWPLVPAPWPRSQSLAQARSRGESKGHSCLAAEEPKPTGRRHGGAGSRGASPSARVS